MVGLKDKIASLPDSPGVYLMKDGFGNVLYIGKAKSLRRRLHSYIAKGLSAKTLSLMSKVCDIEYRPCLSESMALILEASLIHQHKPKYNVSLRDDKSFPFVKITNEDFPAVYVTRRREPDGAEYFGPYTNAALLRDALKIIRRSFPYRSCKALPKKACIYYRIRLSPAPCIGKISKAGYAGIIRKIRLILEGRNEALIKELSGQMRLKAKEHKFEEAAVLRDKISALSSMGTEFPAPQEAICQLKDILRLTAIPRRVEAFDVSHILGRQASASMVSFYDGLADKDNYRRFRIKTVEGGDDYMMLAEAVGRRYRRVKEEGLPLPDLILIDGGKGQLSAVKNELAAIGLDIPLIGLAKRQEQIYTLNSRNPVRLKNDSAALRLLQRIRDESHRFALKYHRLLRKKKFFNEEN